MHNIVLIPGDGIGPEITQSVTTIIEHAGVKINWIPAKAGLGAFEESGDPLPAETEKLIDTYRIALKGPLTTPVGSGFRSVNVALRKKYNLFANLRPAKTLPNVPSPVNNVDLVLFRENTQGLYIGNERYLDEAQNQAESIAYVDRASSEKIIVAAYEYARKFGRKKVSIVHKANILKFTSGLFLKVGKEIAERYPDIQTEEIIVDNMAMQMVMRPERFDVVVTTNLFGDILSDLASGLVGGLGVTGAANLGDNCAIFEAVHGSAPDIAGKNMANPIALLFSALLMLEYIGEVEAGKRIHNAVLEVLANHKDSCTRDIGGKGTTTTFTNAVVQVLQA
jgi:isocitrate dehydrogenase (NAD+)